MFRRLRDTFRGADDAILAPDDPRLFAHSRDIPSFDVPGLVVDIDPDDDGELVGDDAGDLGPDTDEGWPPPAPNLLARIWGDLVQGFWRGLALLARFTGLAWIVGRLRLFYSLRAGADSETARLRAHELAWLKTKVVARGTPRIVWLITWKTPVWAWYLFRDLIVGAIRVGVHSWQWLHFAEERRAARKMDSNDSRARTLREINKDARFRLIAVGVLAGIALAAHLVWYYGWQGRYAPWMAIEALAIVAFLEWVGHKPAPDQDAPVRRRGALTHGTSTRTLRVDLEEAFAAKKIPDAGVIGMGVNKFGWHGVFETEAKLTDDIVEHLERWVHAPPGSILVTVDSRNSAAHPFKLLIDDPLATSSVPEIPQAPRDIRQPAEIGRHLFGQRLQVNLRQHIGLIGRSGSGKSSGLWVLIDWVTSCANAEGDGIDLTNGPAIPIWRRCLRRRGFTTDEAHSILDEAIALAIERNTELARRAEHDDDADLDENWDPTPLHPARYIFADEFHVIADDKDLLEKVKLLVRIGRKACVYVVLATPGASKEDLGSTVIKSMVGLKILFACIIQDVTQFLGGRMAEVGWRPDKLAPAAAGNPRDAGKAYVWDGDHQEPEVCRISRLTANDCRDRARKRSAIIAPVDLSKRPKTPSRLTAPQVLAAAFDEFERDKIPSAWLEKFVTGGDLSWTFEALRAALKEQGVTTGQIGAGPWGANARGYTRG